MLLLLLLQQLPALRYCQLGVELHRARYNLLAKLQPKLVLLLLLLLAHELLLYLYHVGLLHPKRDRVLRTPHGIGRSNNSKGADATHSSGLG